METCEPAHVEDWKRSKRRLNDCFTFAANASCADNQLSCSSEVRLVTASPPVAPHVEHLAVTDR